MDQETEDRLVDLRAERLALVKRIRRTDNPIKQRDLDKVLSSVNGKIQKIVDVPKSDG